MALLAHRAAAAFHCPFNCYFIDRFSVTLPFRNLWLVSFGPFFPATEDICCKCHQGRWVTKWWDFLYLFIYLFWGRAISQNWMSRMCADWTICALVTQFSPSLSIQFWHPSKNVLRQIDWIFHQQTLKGKIQIWTHIRLLHWPVFILKIPPDQRSNGVKIGSVMSVPGCLLHCWKFFCCFFFNGSVM